MWRKIVFILLIAASNQVCANEKAPELYGCVGIGIEEICEPYIEGETYDAVFETLPEPVFQPMAAAIIVLTVHAIRGCASSPVCVSRVGAGIRWIGTSFAGSALWDGAKIIFTMEKEVLE